MSAKIKQPTIYHSSPRPRGINKHKFEKVYWPFIPVLLAIGLLLPSAISTGALASFIHHPSGKVLSYALSENPNAMLIDTNAQRQAYGEPLLQINSQLSQAATAKASDMAARDYWSHYTPEGSPPWSFVSAAGYNYQSMGENLATGFGNEQAVINAWMASAPHRENLLNSNFTQVGFGFANASHFTATGGQPATIFVAFYARPTTVAPISSAQPASPTPKLADASLASASIISGGFGSSLISKWSPAILSLLLLSGVTFFCVKHLRKLWSYASRGERFVWQHPIFDLGLVLVVVLAVALWQNIGLIR